MFSSFGFASSALPVLAVALALFYLLGNLDLSSAIASAGDAVVETGDFRSGTERVLPAGGGGPTPAAAPAPAGGGAQGRAPAPGQPGSTGRTPAGGPQGGQLAPAMGQPGPAAAGQPRPAGQPPAPGQLPGQGQPQPQPAGGGNPPPQPGGQQGQWALRNELQRLGWDVSGFTDDASAWQALSGRLAQQQQVNQQMAEYARWGQYYVANQRQIQEALARGQGQPTPVPTPGSPGSVGGAAQQEDWWKAPAWNPENEKYISFDPATGAPVVPIGMDPSIAKQYLDYKTWQRETVEKFFRDPIGTLKPGLEQLIRSEAQKIAGQQVAGYGDQQFAQNYVASQPWMFAKDQAGNVQTDYLGQPLLTPAGSKFKHYLEYAQRSGIQDIRAQQQWAYGMVERDALAWQLQQYQAGQQPGGQPGGPAPAAGQPGAQLTPQQIQQQQQQAALNLGGARHIPGSGAQGNNPAPTPGNGGVPRKPIGRNALVNRLQGALQEKGITQLN